MLQKVSFAESGGCGSMGDGEGGELDAERGRQKGVRVFGPGFFWLVGKAR